MAVSSVWLWLHVWQLQARAEQSWIHWELVPVQEADISIQHSGSNLLSTLGFLCQGYFSPLFYTAANILSSLKFCRTCCHCCRAHQLHPDNVQQSIFVTSSICFVCMCVCLCQRWYVDRGQPAGAASLLLPHRSQEFDLWFSDVAVDTFSTQSISLTGSICWLTK